MVHSQLSIKPLPPAAASSAFPATIGRILARRRVVLSPATHRQLLDDLARACVQALPSLDLTGAAQLDQEILAEVAAIPTAAAPQKALRDETQRLARRAREAYRAATATPQRLITKPSGAGRPAETWKRVLIEDVRRALQAAGITSGTYISHDAETGTILMEIVQACARTIDCPYIGSLQEAAGPVRRRR